MAKTHKFVPLGHADIYGKDTAALFGGAWGIALRIPRVWVSCQYEHYATPWRVETRVERGDLAALVEWRPTNERMKTELTVVSAVGAHPDYLDACLMRAYEPVSETVRVLARARDTLRVRVTRGMFDRRRVATTVAVMLEVEEVSNA